MLGENFAIAFTLTLLAGLSTGFGGLIAFFSRQTNKKFLSFTLGFSAGVMVYISFVDILPKAEAFYLKHFTPFESALLNLFFFVIGFIAIALIDRIVPTLQNPHEKMRVEDMNAAKINRKLYRTAMFSAIAIVIHNFPEGMATFFTAYEDPKAGVIIAIAIALHNIPEGIAVSIPFFFATGSRYKALVLATLSGLSEPLGALIGYFLFYPVLGSHFYGAIFSAVAGIMVFVSLDQLLPAAKEYEQHHMSMYGLLLGIIFMGLSLVLLNGEYL